jgi:hypothetical protein
MDCRSIVENYVDVFAKVQNTNLQQARADSDKGRAPGSPDFLVFEVAPDT